MNLTPLTTTCQGTRSQIGRAKGDALPIIEAGLGLARHLGEPHLTARLLSARAYATCIDGERADYSDGESVDAVRDFAESLRLFRQARDRLQVCAGLGNLGNYELSTGDVDGARRHLAEALDIARALNARDGIVYHTFNLGLTEYLAGSPCAAEALFAESLDLGRRMGIKAMVAYSLIGLAMAGHGRVDPGWSARMHGAADQALADLGASIEPLEGQQADLDRQSLRAAMGAEVFEAEYTAGRTLDLAPVADEALLEIRARRAAQGAGALVSEPDDAGSGAATSVLTPRELDVLKLVAQGLSNSEIAKQMALSEHTVHRHMTNTLRKLNLPSRAAAAAWGVRTGLV